MVPARVSLCLFWCFVRVRARARVSACAIRPLPVRDERRVSRCVRYEPSARADTLDRFDGNVSTGAFGVTMLIGNLVLKARPRCPRLCFFFPIVATHALCCALGVLRACRHVLPPLIDAHRPQVPLSFASFKLFSELGACRPTYLTQLMYYFVVPRLAARACSGVCDPLTRLFCGLMPNTCFRRRHVGDDQSSRGGVVSG